MSRARDLVKEFEACTLPAEAFRMDYAAAEKRISENIRKYAEHHGDTSKYHHILTVVWMRLVAAAIRQNPGIDEFARRRKRFTHPACCRVKPRAAAGSSRI